MMQVYNMIEDYLENGITPEVKEYIGALDAEEQFELMGEIRQEGWELMNMNPTEERANNPYNDIYDYLKEL